MSFIPIARSTLSPTIMEVEKYLSFKETNLGGTHFSTSMIAEGRVSILENYFTIRDLS